MKQLGTATGKGKDSIHSFTGTIDSIKQWSKDTVHAFASASKASADGTNAIKKNANSALKGLGVGKTIDFSTFTLQGTPGAHQRGGLAAMVPGSSTGDQHMLSLNGRPISKVESGEGVFVGNRNMMAIAEKMNAQIPRHAKGGYAWPFGPGAHYSPGGYHGVRVDQGVDFYGSGPVYAMGPGRVASGNWGFPGVAGLRLDLSGGTPSGKGISPASSHIYMYEGVQAMKSGLVKAGEQIGKMVGTSNEVGFATGSGQPIAQTYGGPIDPSSHHSPAGEAMWAFLQAIKGGTSIGAKGPGGIGAIWKDIKRQIIRGPKGALGGAAQMGLDHVWQAANKFGRKQAMKAGPAGFGNITAGSVEALAKKMVIQQWGASQWSPFQSLEMGEAGWDVHAQNPSSSAYGLAQNISPSTYPAAGRPGSSAPIMDQARAQLTWMINYIQGRYGTPSSAYSTWLGRSPHWYGTGADFVTTGRQVIGVGEKGRERVTITPEGQTKRYAITITNWKQGTGYMEEIADGAVNGQRRLGNQLSRMSRA